ncbi:MAG: hypothetical protein ACK4NS_12745 [Saprospiraceae bacterium]
MKNKHLVLIFAAVLAAAWISRRLPWKYGSDVSLKLVTLNPSQISSLEFAFADGVQMNIDQIQGEWIAAIDQEPRSIKLSAAQIDTLLGLLCRESQARIIRTHRPDTLRMDRGDAVAISVKSHKGYGEQAWLGDARHGSAHARVGALPDFFALSDALTQFLKRIRRDLVAPDPAFPWPKGALRAAYINPDTSQSIFLLYSEASGLWTTPDQTIALDTAQMSRWIAVLKGLCSAPRSAQFDDSDAESDCIGAVKLSFESGAHPLEIRIYRQEGRGPSGYFFQTSAKPQTYYAIAYGAAAAEIFAPGRR